MANIPQKSPNPTEDALNAIQEALTAGQDERRSAPPAASVGDSDRTQIPAQPVADLFNEAPEPAAAESDATPPRRAANDDRADLGQMLQALHHRPARTPYVLASVAAFIWAAGGLYSLLGALCEAELSTMLPRAGRP